MSGVTVACLSALLPWRTLECKTLLCFILHLSRKSRKPSHSSLHSLVPSPPFPYASFLTPFKKPSILLVERHSLEPSHAVFSSVSFLPGTLAFLDIQFPQGTGWARARIHHQCAPKPCGLGCQMSFSVRLLGDRKLNATDQGPSDNRLSALTTHTDLELIK